MGSQKKAEPRSRKGREPPRRKFARWFAAPLLAAGLALGACNMAQSPGQDQAPAPDASPPQPCETITHNRAVNETTTQRQELTYCDGVLEMEVSTFIPPLDDGLHRQYVWIGEIELSVLSIPPRIVDMAFERGRYVLSPGDSVQVLDGQYELRVESIDGWGAYITVNNGTTDVAENYLIRVDYSWYQFDMGDGTILIIDLYGHSLDPPTADISVFRGEASPIGGTVGHMDEIHYETITGLLDGYFIHTPDGRFDVEVTWREPLIDHRLLGWTLSKE